MKALRRLDRLVHVEQIMSVGGRSLRGRDSPLHSSLVLITNNCECSGLRPDFLSGKSLRAAWPTFPDGETRRPIWKWPGMGRLFAKECSYATPGESGPFSSLRTTAGYSAARGRNSRENIINTTLG